VTFELSQEAFDELVAEALDEIPEPFASLLDNVQVVVEDEPGPEHLENLEGDVSELFGLYQGVPQTERDQSYTFVLPDKISIFRGPLQRACDDEDDLYDEIAVTIVHEVAHHFGISEERLTELGWD
jgi:predicted Zn-dependent protease with MMP-like domain